MAHCCDEIAPNYAPLAFQVLHGCTFRLKTEVSDRFLNQVSKSAQPKAAEPSAHPHAVSVARAPGDQQCFASAWSQKFVNNGPKPLKRAQKASTLHAFLVQVGCSSCIRASAWIHKACRGSCRGLSLGLLSQSASSPAVLSAIKGTRTQMCKFRLHSYYLGVP